MINKAIIRGYVADEPLIRATEGGYFASVRLATIEYLTHRKSGEKYGHIEWHRIALWGDLARRIDLSVRIGDAIEVEGVLRTRDWTSKDGTKHRTTDIVANKLQILENGIEGYAIPKIIADQMPRPRSSSPSQESKPQELTVQDEIRLPAADVDDLPF